MLNPAEPRMRSRRLFSIAALSALGAMLFAQAAIALAACDGVRFESHASIVVAHGGESTPCHEPEKSAGLCLAHCQHADQTLDKHQVKVPAAVLLAMPLHDKLQAPAWPGPAVPRLPVRAAGPPARILFQSLLI